MGNNDGIIINNGTVNAKNIAVGANSTINDNSTHTNHDLQQLSVLFNELLEKLHTSQEPISNKEDILDAIAELKEQIKQKEPRKSMLKILGKTLVDNLGNIKHLVPLAQNIWHHISSFIGSAAGV
ncbi:hypothetical protein FAM09_10585 [Niastella caeni]|uniref:DUF4404 family protein n=1 Tax=Niastella caeni TaxID=2569763 RepID=A0A4S8HXT0_9BACT|nr:hypothetical protein [Niastella caeni]THU40305.1 hypothetical protein FAM09_10585 [Niastella caeni]